MATPFQVELVTPERVLFSGEADEVSMRTDGGEIAFLAHHEEFIGAVDITVVHIHVVEGATNDAEAGNDLVAAVHGGFVHVHREGVRILAGVAELATEIDVERARAALERAESSPDSDDRPGEHPEGDGEAEVAKSPAMIAILEPESSDARTRRARVRLEAAGVTAAL